MAIELRPLGVTCNLQCQYCYQHPQRDAGNLSRSYDLAAMKASLGAVSEGFTLFGGEPLLMPKADLTELWAWGFERYGSNAVQTNATLIDDDHIAMFRRYAVRVGVSIDGPGGHNDARWLGTLERTRAATERAQAALERLCDEQIPVGLIVTLHSVNASPERLPGLLVWIRQLAGRGLRSMRLHLLESESGAVRASYALSEENNIAAMRGFLDLSRLLPGLRVEPFGDMRRMLAGDDASASCTWKGCDPYDTEAVNGVEGDGSRSNCGRTNKEGIDFEPAGTRGMERSLALSVTPQEHGGCKGCRFFMMCKGQCPGTALHGDWRNRSEHCGVWKAIYADLEAEMAAGGERPLSLSGQRPELEHGLTAAWHNGETITLAELLRRPRRQESASPASFRQAKASPPDQDAARHPLPPFSRTVWVSARAREVWEPRLEKIRAAWARAQWYSVETRVRPCALLLGRSATDLDRAGAHRRGLATHQLWTGRRREHPRGYAIVVGADPTAVAEFRIAWEQDDHDRIGELLGCPSCCSRFHRELGIGRSRLDATWELAGTPVTGGSRADSGERVADCLADSNILWRPLGVVPVPHHPCSFACLSSAALAGHMRRAAQDGVVDETALAWRDEILSWPAQWSALHGIAELKGPVVKIAYRTEMTAERRLVRLPGTAYPDEAAHGIAFPFIAPVRVRLTSGAAFRRGLRNAAKEPS